MKNLILFALALCTLFACNKDNGDNQDTAAEAEDYYDCTDFFLTGDYSTFCTIETPIVTILKTTIDGSGTICGYTIPPLDGNTEVNTGVQFLSWETSDYAKGNFDFRKKEADSVAASDPKKVFTEITIDGYDGFIYEGQYANYAKQITINYKNVNVSTSVIYFKEWYPDVAPCNYETNELTKLMTLVIANM